MALAVLWCHTLSMPIGTVRLLSLCLVFPPLLWPYLVSSCSCLHFVSLVPAVCLLLVSLVPSVSHLPLVSSVYVLCILPLVSCPLLNIMCDVSCVPLLDSLVIVELKKLYLKYLCAPSFLTPNELWKNSRPKLNSLKPAAGSSLEHTPVTAPQKRYTVSAPPEHPPVHVSRKRYAVPAPRKCYAVPVHPERPLKAHASGAPSRASASRVPSSGRSSPYFPQGNVFFWGGG